MRLVDLICWCLLIGLIACTGPSLLSAVEQKSKDKLPGKTKSKSAEKPPDSQGQNTIPDQTEIASLQSKGIKIKLRADGLPVEVSIDGNVPMSLEDYRVIGRCSSLVRANLSAQQAPLDDDAALAIGHLAQLEYLFSNGAEISDEGLKALAGLKSLKRLGFDHWGHKVAKNGMLGAGLAYLAPLTNLQAIRLGGCRIDSRACEGLAQVKSLEAIDFFHSLVRDEGIAALKDLPKLRILSLSPQFDPRITDKALIHVGEIVTLEEFNVSETWFTYADGFIHLKKLKSLKKITLNQVVASDEDITKLKADHAAAEIKWTKPDEARCEKTKADFLRRAREDKNKGK
jgi:hypothetical protein